MLPDRGLDRTGILHRGHCGVSQSPIQVAKKTLKATVENAGPTNEGVQTVIKVEVLMNSRPLTNERADARDEPVLKPIISYLGSREDDQQFQVMMTRCFIPGIVEN